MLITDIRSAAAQMVMPRIEGSQLADPAYRSEAAALAAEGIGGFILFGGDIESTPAHLAELNARASVPLLISSDVERGLGQQLAGGTRFPGQRAVAAAVNRRSKRDADLLDAMLDAVRAESRAAGIHIVFSPVMDVNNNPENPIICTRSFGETPETVEWFGSRYIRRLQRTRPGGTLDLLACAKHFPGHGDTDQDSHSVLPLIGANKARLNRVELPPFREAVKAGVGTIMVAHLLVPALDPLKPVTFSKKVVTALLREGMEFEGLIVSDALDMGALANDYPPDEIAVRSVEAGMDILLHPADARRTVDAVVRAVAEGRLTEERVQESVDRIAAWKRRLGLFDREPKNSPKIDYARHRKIAGQLASRALTVVRGQRSLSCLGAGKGITCCILDDDGTGEGGAFREALVQRFGDVRALTLGPGMSSAGRAPHTDLDAPGPVVLALFSKISASKGRSGLSPDLQEQAVEVIRRAKAAKKHVSVVSFDSPYLLRQFRDADVLIAGYDRMDAIQRAAAELLAGSGGR